MSQADSSSDNQQYSRQPTKAVFGTELAIANLEHQPGDEERSPKYLVLPSGDAANRVSVAGVVVDVEDKGSDNPYYQIELNDPTGTPIFAYVSQYQPEALKQAEDLEPPEHVIITGKPRTFTPDGSDEVYVSVRPETLSVVSGAAVDAWAEDAIEQTLARLEGDISDENTRDWAPGLADAAYGTEDIHNKVVGTVQSAINGLQEGGAGAASDEADDVSEGDALTREQLDEMDYGELRSLGSEFDDVNGNWGGEKLKDALEGKSVPA